jgi:hypothetical protein
MGILGRLQGLFELHSSDKLSLMSVANKLSVLNFTGVAISVVPLYGYFVHAYHDSPQVGLLVILAWLLTCVFVICSLIQGCPYRFP